MAKIIAIGSATKDVFLKNNFEVVNSPSTSLRKAYLLPLGEKLEVEEVFETIGGNALNASITFTRQGLKVKLLTKIGNDFFGKDLLEKLKKEGVQTDLISKTSKKSTAYSVILLTKGERTILNYHGALDTFNLKDVDFKDLKSQWWYLSLAGRANSMFNKLMTFAFLNGISVALNPTVYQITHYKKDILKNLKNITFLVLNKGEASMLTGVSFNEREGVFKKLDKFMPGILAVTDGDKGALVSDGRFIYRVGVFKEKFVLDRTGAGDAFGSGFVAGLIQQGFSQKNIKQIKPENVVYALRLASANATAVVEKIGANSGILTKKDFEKNPRWQKLKVIIQKT